MALHQQRRHPRRESIADAVSPTGPPPAMRTGISTVGDVDMVDVEYPIAETAGREESSPPGFSGRR